MICEMYLSSVILIRNLFFILNVILFSQIVPAQSIGEMSNLERRILFAVSIQPAYAVKRVDIVTPESKSQPSHIQDLKELVKTFMTTQDYLFFSEGLHDCRKPLLVQKNSNQILGLTPFRMTFEHDLSELEYGGYKIRFSTENIENSPLLQGFKREKIMIEDVNDLIVALIFLADQTTGDAFWLELNQNILDNDALITVIRSQKAKLVDKLEESRNHTINTNSFMVQHMLYNRILLDDVYVLVEVLKYLSKRGLAIGDLFGSPSKLDKYFIQEDLVQTERTQGRRVAMDKLLAKHRFSYRNLVTTLATMPTPTMPTTTAPQNRNSQRRGRQHWKDELSPLPEIVQGKTTSTEWSSQIMIASDYLPNLQTVDTAPKVKKKPELIPIVKIVEDRAQPDSNNNIVTSRKKK